MGVGGPHKGPHVAEELLEVKAAGRVFCMDNLLYSYFYLWMSEFIEHIAN